MNVTSHDVAQLAGVNQSTVSRALRGAPGISADTRRRVLEAAESLSYVPSDAGRALSTRRTGSIGILSGELTNPFYPELVEPIRESLLAAGYRPVLIPDSPDEPFDPDRWARGVFDGMILATAREGSHVAAGLRRHRIPFVFVNRAISGVEADRCVSDNLAGAESAARLLAELGHTQIAAIMGPNDTSTGEERDTGFREGLRRAGIGMPDDHVERGEFTFDVGYSAATRLVSRVSPTAIFCANDVLAFGATDALLESGASHKTMLVGYDDISSAKWRVYNLTTVHSDISRMARTAVELLLSRLAEPHLPYRTVTLDTSIVRRRLLRP
ncbi:LacI family DNA-binding transcriptional regulator [Paramicrobacterium fandaimingii]|uniref:LacI family DNA-binding transcriptional regulator n=1 Tax=Paramicrobacterium fandaimingii TaxID=2708079 RepID=UPI001421F197|nr:LacI family DNA-binding transcriptional regulator [Microbacterium fandaimingii]